MNSHLIHIHMTPDDFDDLIELLSCVSDKFHNSDLALEARYFIRFLESNRR